MSRQKWNRQASELLGQEVVDAVPLARRKADAAVWFVLGAAAFALVVFLHGFGVIPGPTLLAYFPGALLMSLAFQYAHDVVFLARTAEGRLEVMGGSRLQPQPRPPVLGAVDPATIQGPKGLLRNSYDIGGTTHQVGWQHRRRFEAMRMGQSAA